MQPDEIENQMPDEDAAIQAVLGDNPRAAELRAMISALSARRTALLREAERTTTATERFKLEARLAELAMQLKTLRDEEAITTFVEDSVRVSLHRPPPEEERIEGDE